MEEACAFCGELVPGSGSSQQGEESKGDRKWLEEFLRSVVVEDMEGIRLVEVCGECGGRVKQVMERRKGMEEREGIVRDLEGKLEEARGKWEEERKEYWEEMRRLKVILRNAGEGEKDIAGEGDGAAFGGKPEVTKQEIRNFLRESVSKVIREEGEDGFVKRRKSGRLKKTKVVESRPVQQCVVKIEGDNLAEGMEGDVSPAKSRRGSEVTSELLELAELDMDALLIKEEPLDEQLDLEQSAVVEGVIGGMMEGSGAKEGNKKENEEDDFEPEVISEVIGVGPRRRTRRKRKANINRDTATGEFLEGEGEGMEGDIDFAEETSDDDFFLDEGDEDLGSSSEQTSSCSSEENNSSEEEEVDPEVTARKKGKTKLKNVTSGAVEGTSRKKRESRVNPDSKKSRKAAYTSALASINFSSMSKPKRKLIQRLLHKQYRRPTRRPKTPGKSQIPDPRLDHFIQYNPTLDQLTLCNIPILLTEFPSPTSPSSPPLLHLTCSLCNFQAHPTSSSRHPVDSSIFNHVASQHLNLFQCVQCGSNLGGFKQYSDHILGHRLGFACDVCGRPLGGAQALARHKWSHLNSQETADLVSRGLKDPREKKQSSKNYPCPTCGKTFPQRCQLKKHEKVHLQVRERITCEICGKLFLPSGFISHKRYYCFPEGAEQPRISCPVCPKVFKNKQFMQVHMDRAHNSERNWKCEKCGKGFKTKKDLMTHEETHTTQRAFLCKKGCGRGYKTRKNCNAHEKRCDGRGGVLVQRFLDAGEERPFGCRKGCGRKYKTRRTLRGHEKGCRGVSFVGGGEIGGEGGGKEKQGDGVEGEGEGGMAVLGAALQASMEAVLGGIGGAGQQGVVQLQGDGVVLMVPEAVVTETVVTKLEEFG